MYWHLNYTIWQTVRDKYTCPLGLVWSFSALLNTEIGNAFMSSIIKTAQYILWKSNAQLLYKFYHVYLMIRIHFHTHFYQCKSTIPFEFHKRKAFCQSLAVFSDFASACERRSGAIVIFLHKRLQNWDEKHPKHFYATFHDVIKFSTRLYIRKRKCFWLQLILKLY